LRSRKYRGTSTTENTSRAADARRRGYAEGRPLTLGRDRGAHGEVGDGYDHAQGESGDEAQREELRNGGDGGLRQRRHPRQRERADDGGPDPHPRRQAPSHEGAQGGREGAGADDLARQARHPPRLFHDGLEEPRQYGVHGRYREVDHEEGEHAGKEPPAWQRPVPRGLVPGRLRPGRLGLAHAEEYEETGCCEQGRGDPEGGPDAHEVREHAAHEGARGGGDKDERLEGAEPGRRLVRRRGGGDEHRRGRDRPRKRAL
jgi:hypothetical protein